MTALADFRTRPPEHPYFGKAVNLMRELFLTPYPLPGKLRKISRMSYLAQVSRVAIRHIRLQDYEEFTALVRESAEMHSPWMPGRPITTREVFESYLTRFEEPLHEGFVLCLRETGAIVGRVNVNNMVRGTNQSGTLGYAAYASTTGRGYMTEGLGLVIQFAFGALGLHRLEANIQPANTPSLNLVKRLGFQREGYSANFQFINGAWRDHERWAITIEMTRPETSPQTS